MSITIDKGIPMPPSIKTSTYPFGEMEVGDSFLVPGAKSSAQIAGSINYRRNRYGEKHRCAVVDGGLRVWRVA